MSIQGFPARGTAFGCLLFSLFVAAAAPAEDDDVSIGEASGGETTTSPEEAEEEKNGDDALEAAPPVPAEQGTSISVERLPASAYPEPRVRGIVGGSLRWTMHGLQWPYMPARAAGASTRIGFSGSGWVDTSYQKIDSGIPDSDPSIEEWRQQSRLVLRATPTYNAPGDWFVQAQGEFVLNTTLPTTYAETIVADDLYVRVGKWNRLDITAGRFQGWEIYHLGMGLDLNTVERFGARTENNAPVDLYGLTLFWDRPLGPGRVAAHYYPTDYLRFELMGQVGSEALNSLAVRPVGILDIGLLKLKVGAEYGKQTPRQQSVARKDKVISRGVAGTLQVVLEPHLEAGVAGAVALVDSWNAQGVLDAGRSTTTRSYGAFANVRVLGPVILGAGANYTNENNLKLDVTESFNDIRTHLQIFGAAQYSLWDELFIKLVVAHANAHSNPLSNPPPVAAFRNKALSARLRLLYWF